MSRLAEEGLVRAAIDNSDGLIPSVSQLGESSGLGVEVDLGRLSVPEAANVTYEGQIISPARMWLGWGDWNVVAAMAPADLARAEAAVAGEGMSLLPIGRFCAEHSGVRLTSAGTSIEAPRLESERFARDSWFQAGIHEYIRRLATVPLPVSGLN